MLQQAQRGQVDVVAVWKLDRLGRSLRHLLDTLAALDGWGVQFVSARDPGIDSTSPTGRLLTQRLGAFAEFEREMIHDRVSAWVARAQRKGVHCGRPRLAVDADDARAAVRAHGGIAPAATALSVSRAALRRRLAEAESGAER